MERQAEPEPCLVNRDSSSSLNFKPIARDPAAASAAKPEAEEAKPAAVGTALLE